VPKLVERSHESKLTILWYKKVQTDRTIPNNKPDTITRNNEEGQSILIDVTISGNNKGNLLLLVDRLSASS
jgi:hypothetical protein